VTDNPSYLGNYVTADTQVDDLLQHLGLGDRRAVQGGALQRLSGPELVDQLLELGGRHEILERRRSLFAVEPIEHPDVRAVVLARPLLAGVISLRAVISRPRNPRNPDHASGEGRRGGGLTDTNGSLPRVMCSHRLLLHQRIDLRAN
jgi:hypothetical protein